MHALLVALTICLLLLSSAGCVTPTYDDSKLAMIKKGITTQEQIEEWFGPATTREINPNGSKKVTWQFPQTKTPTLGKPTGRPSKIDVWFSANGTVDRLIASDGTK